MTTANTFFISGSSIKDNIMGLSTKGYNTTTQTFFQFYFKKSAPAERIEGISPKGSDPLMTKEQKQKIITMRNAGYGYTAVARELGMSKSTVSSFCQKYAPSFSSNKVEETVKNNLLCAPEDGNTGHVEGQEKQAQKRPERVCKVTVTYADKPNEAALAEALRILTNAR